VVWYICLICSYVFQNNTTNTLIPPDREENTSGNLVCRKKITRDFLEAKIVRVKNMRPCPQPHLPPSPSWSRKYLSVPLRVICIIIFKLFSSPCLHFCWNSLQLHCDSDSSTAMFKQSRMSIKMPKLRTTAI